MNEFTVRKIVSQFPVSGTPSCLYLKKLDQDHVEPRMASKTGAVLHKLKCDDKQAIGSGVVISGPNSAKFSTIVELNMDASANSHITSYDVVVNNGTSTNILNNVYSFEMSDTPGDIMTVVFTPKDDLGTIYEPIIHKVLTTAGPPIDSGLTVTGPIECEIGRSVDLVLDSYVPEIDRFIYTVGASSPLTEDPAQPKPRTVTVTPVGAVGQTIPVIFTPDTDSYDEWVPVQHNITLIEVQPIDSGAIITGDNVTPSNLPYDVNISTLTTDVVGYEVTVNQEPSVTWNFNTKDKDWIIDNHDVAPGTVLTITAVPLSATDNVYNPVTKTYTVTAPQPIDSGVTLTGLNHGNSGEPYELGIHNSNPDITSYRILWDGVEIGITDGDPDKWIQDNIPNDAGDTATVTVIPLSNSGGLYNPITKDINILPRLPIRAGIDFLADNEYEQGSTYDAHFVKTNMHPKVDFLSIYYEGNWYTPIAINSVNKWEHEVTEAVNSTQTVLFRPESNDPNWKFLDVTLEHKIIAPAATDSGINPVGNETVYPGDTNTYNWTDTADVDRLKIYWDGVLQGTFTGGTWTSPASSTTVGTRHKVRFVPVSLTGVTYNDIKQDYAVIREVEPVYSTVEFHGPEKVDVGDDVVFNITKTFTDIDVIKIWLNGTYLGEIPGNSTTYTWNGSGTSDGDRLDFTFQAICTDPTRLYTTTDETVFVELDGIPADDLTKTGPTTVTPYGTVDWTFLLANNNIVSISVNGQEVTDLSNVSPTNTPITVDTNVAIGTTIQVCVVAKDDTGLSTVPEKCWPLTVVDWQCNQVPNVTSPQMGVVFNVPPDQHMVHAAPDMVPSDFDSLTLKVKASTTQTFDPGTISTWEVPATNGVATEYDLPTSLGELGLDKLIPTNVDIWVRAYYLITKNGQSFTPSCMSGGKRLKLIPNQAPTAVSDTNTATDGGSTVSFFVLANDTDPEDDPLSIQSVTQPAHGTIAIVGDHLEYTPESGYVGTVSYSYTVTDGTSTDTVTNTIDIGAGNQPPVAVPDNTTAIKGGSTVTINVLANDTDPENNPLTIQSVTQPSHGSIAIVNNKLEYTPPSNWTGTTSYSYTISDGHNNTSSITSNITVVEGNQPPVANNWTGVTEQGLAINIDPTDNDTDPDGDTITIASITQPAHGTATLNGNTITYTPSASYAGTDSLTYTISDGHGHTDTATINYTVNTHPPTANNDTVSLDQDTSGSINVIANDTDPDNDPLSIQSFTQPSHGSIVKTGTSLVYTPNAGWFGTDTSTYVVSDGHGGTDSATVSWVVNEVIPGPVTPIASANVETVTDGIRELWISSGYSRIYKFYDGKLIIQEKEAGYSANYVLEHLRSSTSGSFNTKWHILHKMHPTETNPFNGEPLYADYSVQTILVHNTMLVNQLSDEMNFSVCTATPSGLSDGVRVPLPAPIPDGSGQYNFFNKGTLGSSGDKFFVTFKSNNSDDPYITKVYSINAAGDTVTEVFTFPTSHKINNMTAAGANITDGDKGYIAINDPGSAQKWYIWKPTTPTSGIYTNNKLTISAPDGTKGLLKDGLLVITVQEAVPLSLYLFDFPIPSKTCNSLILTFLKDPSALHNL